MPRKKKDFVDVKIDKANLPLSETKDVSDLIASLLGPDDTEKLIDIGGKKLTMVEFVMFVESILQKASRTLTGVEYEILHIFMEIMRQHTITIGREIYDRYKGGKNDK